MLYSKQMLDLVKTALEMMENTEDPKQMDVLWISAITGLRAIGHILAKKDKLEHEEYSKNIDQWWAELKNQKGSAENRIFLNL